MINLNEGTPVTFRIKSKIDLSCLSAFFAQLQGPMPGHLLLFSQWREHRTIDVEAWASVFWEEALIKFKNWWKSQCGEQYPARTKLFWGFMKCLRLMFENPTLDDEQLTSHLSNILPPCARAQWKGADQQYVDHHVIT
uniref:Uncharacterized protein n=1 Tax=Romanomermis culicivorax TaxID=13658 RepID=A0A915KN22_ROMCU